MSVRRLRTLAASPPVSGSPVPRGTRPPRRRPQRLPPQRTRRPAARGRASRSSRWDRVPGATEYDCRSVAKDQFAPSTGPAPQRSAASPPRRSSADRAQLYWRVRPTHRAATAWTTAAFSALRRAPADADRPGATATSSPSRDRPRRLPVAAVPGASDYDVQSAQDPDFVDPPRHVKTSSTVQLQRPALLRRGPRTYYWEVRHRLVGRRFTPTGPHPRLHDRRPRQHRARQRHQTTRTGREDVALDWAPVPGAEDYDIQISTD